MTSKRMLLSLTAAFSLHAAASTQSVATEVPFEFEANGIALPAGRYRLLRAALTPALRLTGAVSGTALRFRTRPSDEPFRCHTFFFHRYGERYFLSAVADDNTGITIELPMNPAERVLATRFQPETVVKSAL